MVRMKLANTRALRSSLGAFERVVDLEHALGQQEQPAEEQDDVAPREPPAARRGTTAWSSRVSHTMENSSAMRVSIASARPVMRADLRRSGGRRPTRIEMKMMLSMPRTISSNDSVTNASHACGSESSSIMRGPGIRLRQQRYGKWSTAVFFTVGNMCSALSPQSSATAAEM